MRIAATITLSLSLFTFGCEKQPTTAPTEGDAPAADSAGDAPADPPAEEPKEGGW